MKTNLVWIGWIAIALVWTMIARAAVSPQGRLRGVVRQVNQQTVLLQVRTHRIRVARSAIAAKTLKVGEEAVAVISGK